MSALPWVGVGLLASAALVALIRMLRSGDSRWWLLSAMLSLLAGMLALEFIIDPGIAPSLSAGPVDRLVLAATCALGLLVGVAYTRTANERDRAQILHWESMESIRELAELPGTARGNVELEAVLNRLLDLGRARFGLEIGLVSRIDRARYEVIAVRGPLDLDLSRGEVLDLDDTFCERVIAARRTLYFDSPQSPEWSEHPARLSLGFESYLGAVIQVDGAIFGTLCFASRKPSPTRFSATQRDLVNLLARWVGFEINRAVADAMVRAKHAADSPPRPPSRRAPAGLDINASLNRMEEVLRRRVGAGIDLSLSLARELPPARAPRVAFRQLVLALVREAVASMPEGGALELETGALKGFVTLAVRDSGGAVEPEKVAERFEKPSPAVDPAGRGNGAALSLAEVERILRGGGGDLSIDLEPGRGTTRTLYLPMERDCKAAADEAGVAAGKGASKAAKLAPRQQTQLSLLT